MMPRTPRLLLVLRRAAAATATVAAAGLIVTAAPAQAGQGSGNPTLEVSQSSVPIDGPSTVTVTGTDYLVPPSAPGTQVFGGMSGAGPFAPKRARAGAAKESAAPSCPRT